MIDREDAELLTEGDRLAVEEVDLSTYPLEKLTSIYEARKRHGVSGMFTRMIEDAIDLRR